MVNLGFLLRELVVASIPTRVESSLSSLSKLSVFVWSDAASMNTLASSDAMSVSMFTDACNLSKVSWEVWSCICWIQGLGLYIYIDVVADSNTALARHICGCMCIIPKIVLAELEIITFGIFVRSRHRSKNTNTFESWRNSCAGHKATLNCRIRVRIMDWSGTPLFYVINLGKSESDPKSCLKLSLTKIYLFLHNAHLMKNMLNVASVLGCRECCRVFWLTITHKIK